MKVSTIQNRTDFGKINYNCKPKSAAFKGQTTLNAIREVRYPKSIYEWAAGFSKMLDAVKNDSELVIKNSALFDKLMECQRDINSLKVFIGKNIIDGMKLGEFKEIANDGNGNPAIAFVKDIKFGEKIQFVQFFDSCVHNQFGLADANLGKKRFCFYKDGDLYVDFHDVTTGLNGVDKEAANYSLPSSSKTGGIRKLSPHTGSAVYYKENGKEDFFGGLKDLFNMS